MSVLKEIFEPFPVNNSSSVIQTNLIRSYCRAHFLSAINDWWMPLVVVIHTVEKLDMLQFW